MTIGIWLTDADFIRMYSRVDRRLLRTVLTALGAYVIECQSTPLGDTYLIQRSVTSEIAVNALVDMWRGTTALVSTHLVANADGSVTRVPQPLFAAIASAICSEYVRRKLLFSDLEDIQFDEFANSAWEGYRLLLDLG